MKQLYPQSKPNLNNTHQMTKKNSLTQSFTSIYSKNSEGLTIFTTENSQTLTNKSNWSEGLTQSENKPNLSEDFTLNKNKLNLSEDFTLSETLTNKHFTFFIALLLFSYSLFSQNASGNITFKTTAGTENMAITVVATDLFDSGNNVYNLSGNTNSAISFNSWKLTSSLGLEDFLIGNSTFLVFRNGSSSELDAFISTENYSDIKARVFNMLGQQVASPQIFNHGNTAAQIYSPLEGLAPGVYVVQAKGPQTDVSFKFFKGTTPGNGPDAISYQTENKFSQAKSQATALLGDNYTIDWNKGFGLVNGTQDVEIVEGNTNAISVGVTTLDDPFFTINGSIDEGETGTAALYVNNAKISEGAINNNSFSLTDILSNFDANNLVDNVVGELRLSGATFDNKNVAMNLTTDNPGENVYNTGTIDVDLVATGNETGDVGIATRIRGGPELGTRIKLTNMQVQDSTYTLEVDGSLGVFYDIYVASGNNPTQYKVEIEDLAADGTFLPTTQFIDMYQDENFEINGTKIVNLNELPTVVDLTVVARESINETFDQNVELELHKASDSTLIASGFTGADGKLEFKGVEGGIKVYTVAKEAGSYTKMNESYLITTPSVISQLKDYINVITTHKFNFPDNTPATAAKLMEDFISEYNVEFIRKSDEIYLAPSDIRDIQIEHINNYAREIGFEGAVKFTATQPFDTPTTDQLNQYEIFEPNRNTFDGIIGTNAEPFGTTTVNDGKTLANGKDITIWSRTLYLGGQEENRTHHEIRNHLNGPLKIGYSVGNPIASESARAQDVPNETRATKFWYKLGEQVFNKYDVNNKPLEFSQTKSIKNN